MKYKTQLRFYYPLRLLRIPLLVLSYTPQGSNYINFSVLRRIIPEFYHTTQHDVLKIGRYVGNLVSWVLERWVPSSYSATRLMQGKTGKKSI